MAATGACVGQLFLRRHHEPRFSCWWARRSASVHRHRSVFGTPLITAWTCWPQPAQVFLRQTRHWTVRHILLTLAQARIWPVMLRSDDRVVGALTTP